MVEVEERAIVAQSLESRLLAYQTPAYMYKTLKFQEFMLVWILGNNEKHTCLTINDSK